MKIFDTHSHYNLAPFSPGDWEKHWQKAQEHGVVASVVIGTTFAESSLATQIAATDPRLGAAIGIHPAEYNQTAVGALQRNTGLASIAVNDATEDALEDIQTDMDELRLIFAKEVVAIGETGLDYFHFQDRSDVEKEFIKTIQRAALHAHLRLADGKVPVILHVRDQAEEAYWDVLHILKEENYSGRFILHCVSGPLEYVQEALAMGAYVSVAGNVTYTSADHLRAIVRAVPADRLLVETDAPFLPPVPYRGKDCEPWMISKTMEYLVQELKIDSDQVLANSYRLFPTLQSPE